MNQMFSYETRTGVETVTKTALTYQLLSQYRAFVAVSDHVRVNPQDKSISMAVPVEMPEAVSDEEVFGEIEMERPRAISMDYMISTTAPAAPTPSPSRDIGFSQTNGLFKKRAVSQTKEAKITSESTIEFVSAEGLDATNLVNLNKHLQQINLSSNYTGEILFKLTIDKNRVRQVILDQNNSNPKISVTLAGKNVIIEVLKISLLKWIAPQSFTGKVIVTLRLLGN